MINAGVELLDGMNRGQPRHSNQTPNTASANWRNSVAVRLRGLSSVGQKGNSPDLNLRSLNVRSVHVRRCNFSDGEEVGLEAATL